MKDRDAKRLSQQHGIRYVHAHRLVGRARDLVAAEDLTFEEALGRVLQSEQASAQGAPRFIGRRRVHSAPRTLADELRGQLAWVCEKYLAGQDVAGKGSGPSSGLVFGGVSLPDDIVKEIWVELAEPDLDTVDWSVAQEYEGGTQAVNVQVVAKVTFNGLVPKQAARHLAAGVSLEELDWDERMSRVAMTRLVTLTFIAVLEPDLPDIGSFEYMGAEDLDS